MITAPRITDLRSALEPLRPDSEIGLVPTMGALHAGHLSLIEAARAENDVVVVSIFVNPAQFGPSEDFARYPRDEEEDARRAEANGVDFLFIPSADEMYPDGFQTWVEVEELSRGMEGDARPEHFRGVATVCLKLFNIIQPTRAYFGQKDAQQVAVIERVVRDLNLTIGIRVLSTVRDEDGLALSSRNDYLTPEERQAALVIPRALSAGREAHRAGGNPVAVAREVLLGERRVAAEYVELAQLNGRIVLAVAARVGTTRLIDNVVLEGEADG